MYGLDGTVVTNMDGSTHTVTQLDIYQTGGGAFRVGGTWWGATAWANTLDFAGTSGWRLPTSTELVGVLSDPSYYFFTHSGSAFSYLFWTSTEIGASNVAQVQLMPSGTPAYYEFSIPKQLDQSGGFIQVAWAVHQGNVLGATSPVPEPETYAMLLAGLALVGRVTWRRHIPE
jgi:hypothetical protein